MSRSVGGWVLLALLAVGAFSVVAVLPDDGSRADTSRLYALPPYKKPPVPGGYAPSTVKGLWRLQTIEADDRTLVIRAASSGCWKFDYVSVDSMSTESIRLTAWNEEWTPTRENYGCTLELGIADYRVRLPERVAGRRIEGECRDEGFSPEERQCDALRRAENEPGVDD